MSSPLIVTIDPFENLPPAFVGVYVTVQNDPDPIVFDATIESDFSHEAEVTSNPVETNDGDVTDHRRTKPLSWRFRALLLAEDQDPTVAHQRHQAGHGSKHDPLRAAREHGPAVDPGRASSTLDRLKAAFASNKTLTVVTDLGYITNAVLASLQYKQISSGKRTITTGTAATGLGVQAQVADQIEINGVFRQIRFATTETVELPAEPVSGQTGKKVKRGTVNGKPADAGTTEKSKSWAKGFFGGLD